MALNDGVDPRTGVQIGPQCGDLTTFESIEEVKAAFERQVAFFAELVVTASNMVIPVRAQLNLTPFLSVFVEHNFNQLTALIL